MRPTPLQCCLTFGSILLAVCLLLAPAPGTAQIPVTGGKDGGPAAVAAAVPDLIDFTAQVTSGSANLVTGIYVDGVFAFPVVQQPAGQPGFVSTAPDTLTQFGQAADYGSLGFLARRLV